MQLCGAESKTDICLVTYQWEQSVLILKEFQEICWSLRR